VTPAARPGRGVITDAGFEQRKEKIPR